jgi:hypothetical protein
VCTQKLRIQPQCAHPRKIALRLAHPGAGEGLHIPLGAGAGLVVTPSAQKPSIRVTRVPPRPVPVGRRGICTTRGGGHFLASMMHLVIAEMRCVVIPAIHCSQRAAAYAPRHAAGGHRRPARDSALAHCGHTFRFVCDSESVTLFAFTAVLLCV